MTAAPPMAAEAALNSLDEALLARRPLLVVCDFDGTLSPIVSDPWAAAIVPLARRALRRLTGVSGVEVSFLSGRTALDVASRARVGGARYVGNHGLERGRLARRGRADRMAVALEEAMLAYAAAADALADGVAAAITEPWLVVERKPPAVSFHYRTAPDLGAAADRVRGAVDRFDPDGAFVRFPGRRVLELRPPGAIAKGGALTVLLDEVRPAAAFVLGDDRSDAEAFLVLRAAREEGRLDGRAISVHARAEVPPEVSAAADLALASPLEAARFLSGLERRLRPQPASDGERRLDPPDRVAQLP